ncbi:MAG: Uma2 family endonuclease [candidate division KSB1 bacterium]
MNAVIAKEFLDSHNGEHEIDEEECYRLHEIPVTERTDLTYDEAFAMGITEPYELYDGRIVFKMANPTHAYYQTEITIELGLYLRQHRLGVLFTDLNLLLFPNDRQHMRRPDVAFYLNARVPKSDEPVSYAPDLAIEIVGTSSDFFELVEKADLYLSKGSQVVWIVIPAKACVLVWKADGRVWEYQTLTCPELLPGWSLNLAEFFAQSQPTSAA